MKFYITLTLLLASVLGYDVTVLDPPASVTKSVAEIAIVWINGALSNPQSYVKLAQEFQAQASHKGYRVWVGIPHFYIDNTPSPLEFGFAVDAAVDQLKTKGLKTDSELYIAAHSLGTVFAQSYVQSNPTKFVGQILMAGNLLRDHRSNNNETGLTEINYDVPTLSITGTKDGLFRVTRAVEGYFHQVLNIVPSQAGKFPVKILEGVSHGSFMDEDILPSLVKLRDLKPSVSQEEAHQEISATMVNFISTVRGDEKVVSNVQSDPADKYIEPIVEGMKMEGSYNIRVPCYNIATINPDLPTQCERGNKWVTEAQKIMVGDLGGVTFDSFDNFHRVYSVLPHHLPQIKDEKVCKTKDCNLSGWTVSENYYERLEVMDTGYTVTSAYETKAKMLSRQQLQIHAGNASASFHELDDNKHMCKDINKKALEWALSKAPAAALDDYNKYGKKLVFGDDNGSMTIGPTWIWTYLSFKDNKDKTETTVVAPYMSTPADYWESQVRGFHYCKLLNPSRALEWILIDSQFDRNSRTPFSEKVYQEPKKAVKLNLIQ